MASCSWKENWEKRRPLTQAELEREAEHLFDNENNEDDGENIFGTDSESEEDYVEEQNSNTDTDESEQSDSETDHEPVRNVASLLGKNGHRWSTKQPSRRGRTTAANLVIRLPGGKGNARILQSPEEAWNLLFNEEMLDIIVLFTNEEIIRKRESITAQSYTKLTNKIEVKAFIGLLFISGALRVSNSSVDELWSLQFGNGIFRATMSQQRFAFLAVCLRFDDKNTRATRKAADKFAPIRELWEIFISNCTSYYTPFQYCTIDEQLVGFRGKCPFKIYMSSKPDKYGIKIMMMNDSKTFYMVNAIPYVGKVQTQDKESVPAFYVRKLSEPIHGTNRNITVDNWFTSIPLADQMMRQFKLTILGTLRKNKREIPPSFLSKKEVGTSLFAFDENKTIISYTPNPKKVVLLLSTLHHDNSLNADTGKPNLIHTYNESKGGTDTFDQLCHSYTTSRKCRRWPLRIFFNMLDASGINAMVLFSLANTHWKETASNNRKSFLKSLGMALIEPLMRERLQIPSLPKSLRQSICGILQVEDLPTQHPTSLVKQTRCYLCKGKDRKTKHACSACHKAYCMEHRAKLCCECSHQNE